MECFNHTGIPGVGICKSCGKALCPDCITELENGIACKGSCEDRVRMINSIIDANFQTMNAARHQMKTTGISGVIVGIGFIVFAVFAYKEMPDSFLSYFLGTLGFVTMISSALRLTRKQSYPNLNGNEG
jgi:hypothetical protein